MCFAFLVINPNRFHQGSPQGDVSNWASFFDIAPRDLKLDQEDSSSTAAGAGFRALSIYGAQGGVILVVSAAASLPELQRRADITSTLTTLFDMEISTSKLRLIWGRITRYGSWWATVPVGFTSGQNALVYTRYTGPLGHTICGHQAAPCAGLYLHVLPETPRQRSAHRLRSFFGVRKL